MMAYLNSLLTAIDQLSPDELDALYAQLDARRAAQNSPTTDDPSNPIDEATKPVTPTASKRPRAAFRRATAEIRRK
jgi:hypothetical protein